MPKGGLGLLFSFLLTVSRTGTGDGCLFVLEPRASDSKHIKNKTKPVCAAASAIHRNGCAGGLRVLIFPVIGSLVLGVAFGRSD